VGGVGVDEREADEAALELAARAETSVDRRSSLVARGGRARCPFHSDNFFRSSQWRGPRPFNSWTWPGPLPPVLRAACSHSESRASPTQPN
jgi:hypothetical protein